MPKKDEKRKVGGRPASIIFECREKLAKHYGVAPENVAIEFTVYTDNEFFTDKLPRWEHELMRSGHYWMGGK